MAERLLLADDSPTIAKILTMALQSEPYEITTVLNQEDAKRELESNPPFFFLVDLSLPGKDGYQFSTWIKQHAKLKNVRVVLLASAFEPVDQLKYAECKADGLIQKPFDPSELRKVLRKILEAPPVFLGGNVQGSLSGVNVEKTGESVPPPSTPQLKEEPMEEVDLSSLLGEDSQTNLSADEILSFSDSPLSSPQQNIEEPSNSPPPFSTSDGSNQDMPATEFSDATAMIDVGSEASTLDFSTASDERILDLSESFPDTQDGIQPLNTKSLTIEQPSQKTTLKPLHTDVPPPMPQEKQTEDLEKDLSENAQALAAFFDAEIEQKQPAQSTEETTTEETPDNFDQSLDSIDWGSEQPNLSQWTSNAPEPETSTADEPPTFSTEPQFVSEQTEDPMASIESVPADYDPEPEMPPAFSPKQEIPRSARPQPKSSQIDSVGSFMFDTGSSTFRFADDYIERITKSFTGVENEHIPAEEESALPEEPPLFQKKSTDVSTKNHPKLGGGAWTGDEIARMEDVIRQEVQTAVREVLEKVAWEIIPDLAENIIKAELEKVMKEMEN
ncbi:MAG: response regulator [Oligoflexia bacterium]|nr:response regulator [Oligoflexia bacterium]